MPVLGGKMLSRRVLGLAFFTAALASCGEKGSSPSAGVSPPDAPGGVVAEAAVRSAVVSWTAPSGDGGSAILSYNVRAEPGDATATTESTQVNLEGLADGTTYTFVVQAMNAAGVGPWSGASAPVTTFTKPDAPTDVVGIPGDGRVSLVWAAPESDGGSPVTGYEVEIDPAVASASVAIVGTTATVRGLENDVAYTFQVRAISEVGPGPWSEPSAPVSAPTGKSRNNSLAFAFDAPVDGPPVSGISFTLRLPAGVSPFTTDGWTGEIFPAAIQAGPAVPGTPVVMGAFVESTRMVKVAVAVKPEHRWSGEFLRLVLLNQADSLTDADLAAIRASVSDYKVVGFDETTESSVPLTHVVETIIGFAAD